jgi:hypothetical protein
VAKLSADRRGLYFINPGGNQKDKPAQIWTDGETENNSVWYPTLDKPNQGQPDEGIKPSLSNVISGIPFVKFIIQMLS